MAEPLLPLKLHAGRVKQLNASSDQVDARVMGGIPGASKFLKSNNTDNFANWSDVQDSDLSINDTTDNNVTTDAHGFVPRATGEPNDYLSGAGDWRTLPSPGGDASSSASASVNGEAVVFDGTSGKIIKRATGSGVAKLTSGVLSVSNVVESEITLADNTTNNFNATKHGFAPKSPGGSTAFLREDGTWVTPSGTGDVVGPASSVASEVALFDGVTGKLIKRATGSGVAKLTSGVLSVGNVVESEITLDDNTTNDVSITKHGLAPKAPNDITKFLRGDASWAPISAGDVVGPASSVASELALFDLTTGKLLKRATGTGIVRVSSGVYGTPGNIVETEITLADNTTNDASTTKHGFIKKLSNVATQFMNGLGNWAVPAGTPASGTMILLNADESASTGTTSNTSVKTYTVAANTYSRIIAECEIDFTGVANTDCEVVPYMQYAGSNVQSTALRQAATGAGDNFKLSTTMKYSALFSAGGVITVAISVTTGTATWNVKSLRVYAVV